MYLVSKNISPGLREFLVNQCLVSQGVSHAENFEICFGEADDEA